MDAFNAAQAWLVENGFTLATKIVIALIILLLGKFVIAMVMGLVNKSLTKVKKLSELLRNFMVKTLKQLLWILLYVLIAAQFIDVLPIIAGLGILGLVIGLAFQDTLGNFASGLMILANDPYQKGDYVEAGGLAGSVVEMNIMATTLTTPDNRRIVVPNKLIWGAPIVNYTVTGTRRLDITVGISYSSDINKAKEIVQGLLSADERVMDEPAPVVEVADLGDSSVDIVVRPWSKTSDYWGLHFALHQQIKEAFDADGIEIPFPQRVVHMKSEG